MHTLNSQAPDLFLHASERLGGHFRHERGDKLLTATVGGEIVGQAIFSDITPGAKAELTMWFDRARAAGGRTFLGHVFHVPFREWRCRRLTAITRESNTDAQRALVKLGFTFEANLEAWFGDEPGWMFRMLAGECRWLKK